PPRAPPRAGKRAAELSAWKAVQTARREREARRRRDRHQLAEAEQALAALRESEELLPMGRLAADLRLPELKARAAPAKGEGEDALSARRTLAALFVQTALYLPQQALDRKEYRLAASYPEIAPAIRPR